MEKRVPVVLAAALAVVLASPGALAKGRLELHVTGGNLPATLVIPPSVIEGWAVRWFLESPAPERPGPRAYAVATRIYLPEGPRVAGSEWTYYPASDGMPPRIRFARPGGGWMLADPAFAAHLDHAIASAERGDPVFRQERADDLTRLRLAAVNRPRRPWRRPDPARVPLVAVAVLLILVVGEAGRRARAR